MAANIFEKRHLKCYRFNKADHKKQVVKKLSDSIILFSNPSGYISKNYCSFFATEPGFLLRLSFSNNV